MQGNDQLKIGIFCPNINRIGGGQLVAVSMIAALKTKGHKITICSPKINTTKINSFLGKKLRFDENATFFPAFFRKVLKTEVSPYSARNIYIHATESLLLNLKCDLVIDTFSNAVLPWINAVYFQGSPTFYYSYPLLKDAASLYSLYYKALLIKAKKTPRILMTCSKYSAKQLAARTGLRASVLYPPVSRFFRVRNFTANRKNIIVTVSRFSDEKLLWKIPLIAKLIREDVHFIVTGSCDSPQRHEVLQRISRQIKDLKISRYVKLLPNISRQRLRKILTTAKIYLHTAEAEGFGISIIEAMSSGCIPIVHDSGGPPEFVPKPFRYRKIGEAAVLIQNWMTDWSPKKAKMFLRIADTFSEARFSSEFLRLLRAHGRDEL